MNNAWIIAAIHLLYDAVTRNAVDLSEVMRDPHGFVA
jgi:hypothetical protein